MLKRAATAAAIAVFFGSAAGQAAAQAKFDSVSVHRDWNVFATGQGAERVCWIVAKPSASEARRDGKRVQVNRGDIHLMVAVRPGQGVKNEVSMSPGYTFRADSSVRVEIGGASFEMFVDRDFAWPLPADDDRIVAAMRRGADAKVTGVSSRGTTTTDTFSLSGFSAALDEAQRLCG